MTIKKIAGCFTFFGSGVIMGGTIESQKHHEPMQLIMLSIIIFGGLLAGIILIKDAKSNVYGNDNEKTARI